MIKVNKLVKNYYLGKLKNEVLKGIDLEIKDGEYVAITGMSGAGKSTLLYQMGLLDKPTSGEIIIDGISTNSLTDKERTSFRLSILGYIFQDFALMPELTAEENVKVPLLMLNYPMDKATKMAEEVLKKVGLGDKVNNLPSQLSGGEQQRVSIARAIANKPKIIFADEPTANLDSKTAKVVMDVFKDLSKEGQTIIMITHEEVYAKQAKRIIHLLDGKIV